MLALEKTRKKPADDQAVGEYRVKRVDQQAQ